MTGFDDLSPKVLLIFEILVFRSSLHFMLSRVEHDKKCYNLGPDITINY